MKMLKNSLIAVALLTLGFFSNTALAEFQSIVGQQIEGPEFIEIVSNPDFKQLIHKNEVAFVTYDPKNNTNMLKYTLTTKSGAKITISATQLDSLVKQLDYTTLKIV